MDISLITPAPRHSRKGNRVTARRWARILRDLGHRVRVEEEYKGRPCGLMVALHARRSFPSIERFRKAHPDLPLILALTGTDLYGDIHTDAKAKQSLEMASRIIVLQPKGVEELPKRLRKNVRVIYQSVSAPRGAASPKKSAFEVCVVGHLRPVKDPFRAAMAARLLPAASKVQILHVGGALSPAMEKRARAESETNPRYRWVGEIPRWKTLRLLARCRLHVLSSEMEGGANAVCEAIACAVPTLTSRINGSIGLLGADYPGYFPVKDTRALAALLERAETDPAFYQKLRGRCEQLVPLVDPARERKSWVDLVREISA
ncbi:MAG: selenoneine biosynthesis selenosugar synthase SenB [bacterium]